MQRLALEISLHKEIRIYRTERDGYCTEMRTEYAEKHLSFTVLTEVCAEKERERERERERDVPRQR